MSSKKKKASHIRYIYYNFSELYVFNQIVLFRNKSSEYDFISVSAD